MKRALYAIVKVLLVVAGLLTAFVAYFHLRDYSGYFVERRGTLDSALVDSSGGTERFERSWLTLTNDRGLVVRCGMLVPRDGGAGDGRGRKYPAIVVLGGKATGKYAIDYALDIDDVIIVAPDYPYEPRASYSLWSVAADIPEIRAALIDMIPSMMLVLDYLSSRDDVDTTRIIMLGYSFGAPFIPVFMANDRRADVAALVYGGGNLQSLIGHNVARYQGKVVGDAAGWLAGVLTYPLEPVRFVGDIAPRPLIMVNGTQDEQVPRENAEALYAAARDPKKILWIDSRHVNPRNVELTRRIIRTLKSELAVAGVLPPRDASPP